MNMTGNMTFDEEAQMLITNMTGNLTLDQMMALNATMNLEATIMDELMNMNDSFSNQTFGMNVSISELPDEFTAIILDNMTIADMGIFSEFNMPLNTSAEFTEMAEWMDGNAGTMMETIETVVQDTIEMVDNCSNINIQLIEEQANMTYKAAQFDNL